MPILLLNFALTQEVRLGLPNLRISETISEIVNIITSRKNLKQVLSTRFYSNAFYLMLNAVVMSLLGFFFWMVAARFYTEAEVGLSSAIISAIIFLGCPVRIWCF